MTQLPQTKNRHDYRSPDYIITNIDLTFDINSSTTKVTAITQIKRLGSSGMELRLDGEELMLLSLYINDTLWLKYRLEEGALVLSELPDIFTLKIVNTVRPDQNTALQGLYKSGKILCTQCEAEGFRHITWYLDRPDVLARFTTTIIANQTLYPYLLSNGNRVGGGQLENGRHWIRWLDKMAGSFSKTLLSICPCSR